MVLSYYLAITIFFTASYNVKIGALIDTKQETHYSCKDVIQEVVVHTVFKSGKKKVVEIAEKNGQD